MKTLEKQFRKAGFCFNQVFRQGNVAIYEQTKPSQPANIHFEVGRIRQNKAREAFGVHFEASESWPCSEEWGRNAWTYGDLASAKKRAYALIPPDSANP